MRFSIGDDAPCLENLLISSRYIKDFPLSEWVIPRPEADQAYLHMVERTRWRHLGIRLYGISRIPGVVGTGSPLGRQMQQPPQPSGQANRSAYQAYAAAPNRGHTLPAPRAYGTQPSMHMHGADQYTPMNNMDHRPSPMFRQPQMTQPTDNSPGYPTATMMQQQMMVSPQQGQAHDVSRPTGAMQAPDPTLEQPPAHRPVSSKG